MGRRMQNLMGQAKIAIFDQYLVASITGEVWSTVLTWGKVYHSSRRRWPRISEPCLWRQGSTSFSALDENRTDCARGIVLLKLTTVQTYTKHRATAQRLVFSVISFKFSCSAPCSVRILEL